MECNSLSCFEDDGVAMCYLDAVGINLSVAVGEEFKVLDTSRDGDDDSPIVVEGGDEHESDCNAEVF